MGIKGLLKALNPLLVPAEGSSHHHNNHGHGQQPQQQGTNGKYSITAFESTTLAIDASSWLYKAGYACADLLVESIETGHRSPQAESIVCRYVLNRIDGLLTGAKVKGIVLVFDGKRCPLKAGTNREREARRRENLAEARRLRAAGRHAEARERYKNCLKATDEMARVVAAKVQETYGRKNGGGHNAHFGVLPRVRCVFAPYEADAQLAKLCVDGVADAVITEDSDILVYSAAAGVPFPVIYKLDKDTGLCDVVSMDWLLSASSASASAKQPSKPKPLGERKSDRLAPVRRYLPPYGAQDGAGGGSDKQKSSSGTKKSSSSKKGKGGTGTDGPMLAALRSMVNLEERKPGAGRRAFVQSCVLAGCDYAPSLVAGVGTVGAFKQVKENRNRDESVRFRRILMPFRGKIQAYEEEEGGDDDAEDTSTSESQSSVTTHKSKSRKDQEMENLNVYENLLAKSEAVFYYHCVQDVSNGTIVHLTEPQETALGEDGKASASASAASSRRPSKLSVDSLSDDEDSASTTTAASSSAATLVADPRKFHPAMKRFEGDISFVGSLDVSISNNSVGTFFTRKATAKTPLSSLTRTPSAGPVSNPYAGSSVAAPSSAPPAASGMVRLREKTSKGSPTIDALFNAAAAKKSPKAVQSQQQQGKESPGKNMFAGFAHGETGESDGGPENEVICVDDDDNDQSDVPVPVPTEETAELDDPGATSRHFSSKPKSGEKRKVSFDDAPEKKDEPTEAASSPIPAKKTKKDATNRSPASDGSGFWSDGDNDCIVVDEPPPKGSSSSTTSNGGARMSFASAHQSHSSAAPEKARGGKENTGNAPSSATSSGFISVFQSSRMDRVPRGSGKKSKSKSGSGKSQKKKSGSGGLLQGFERQRKAAVADGSSVIKETLEDRQRRLSNASRRSSASSAGGRSKSSTSTGGGATSKKRKSTGSLSGFFGPLDFSKPTRKSL